MMIRLTDDDLELAQSLINKASPGECLIEDIYGELWDAIPKHSDFGKRFKAAVLAGALIGIKWLERTTANRQKYEISGRA